MYKVIGLVLLPLLVCVALYKVDTPAPPGLANPYLLRVDKFLDGCSLVAGFLGSTLGYGELIEVAQQVRRYQYSFFMDNHEGLEVKEAVIDGVPVVIYTPLSAEGTLPAVMYFHGGGFVWQGPVSSDAFTSALARDTPAVVVSVDYRLAPKHPYPAQLDDCYKATQYMMKHADEFGIAPKRIAVSGRGAGGNLAAAVSLKFRDRQERIKPRLQILIEPMLQKFNFQLPSFKQHGRRPFMQSSESAAGSIGWYHGSPIGMSPDVRLVANNSHTSVELRRGYESIFDLSLIPDNMRKEDHLEDERCEPTNEAMVKKYSSFILDPYAYPLMQGNLKHLPRTFVQTSEYDVLRDEGILYAKHLKKDEVRVTWYHSPDTYHGVGQFVGPVIQSDSALRDLKKLVTFLQKKL